MSLLGFELALLVLERDGGVHREVFGPGRG